MITKSKIKHVIMSGIKSVLSKVVGNKYVGGRKNQLRHGECSIILLSPFTRVPTMRESHSKSA